MRPGDQPYRKLARALCKALPELQSGEIGKSIDFVEAALMSGEHALTKLINGLALRRGTCLLVLVDQFEELFRFRGGTQFEMDPRNDVSPYEKRSEVNSFVDLLLETAKRQNCGSAHDFLPESCESTKVEWKCPIFVVLTMRSEFIGNCDVFIGLPDAISKTSFLTPRMTREQMRDAIERPLQSFSAVAQAALVNRILNDVGSDPDSLPLMQHALLRTWQKAMERCSDPLLDRKERIELSIKEYEEIGGFKKALQIHADEAYLELGNNARNGKRLQRAAEILFRLLTRETSERMIVRNPITVSKAIATAEVSEEDLLRVAKVFSQEGRNFITVWPSGRKVGLDSTLDISHESLIRNWGYLQQWVKAETKSVEDYSWVTKAARRWKGGTGGLFSGADLRYALAWEQRRALLRGGPLAMEVTST